MKELSGWLEIVFCVRFIVGMSFRNEFKVRNESSFYAQLSLLLSFFFFFFHPCWLHQLWCNFEICFQLVSPIVMGNYESLLWGRWSFSNFDAIFFYEFLFNILNYFEFMFIIFYRESIKFEYQWAKYTFSRKFRIRWKPFSIWILKFYSIQKLFHPPEF